ncbi:MAG: hypothetical protein KA354_09450 [Phycisphaerae bacterium]|nr:hypothetical protein [Phycisphaerae bacterium]
MADHVARWFRFTTVRGIAGCILMMADPLTSPTAGAPPVRPPASQAAWPVDNPQVWQPRTRSVAVFKNGMGFFMREGEVALRDGWCTAQAVPPAAFGTLAFYSTNQGQIVDVVGSGPGETVDFDDRDAPKLAAEKRERIEACSNMKIALTYTHKGVTGSASGKLVSVSSDFAVLESEQHNFAVGLEEITRLQLLELPLRIHVADATHKPPARAALGMAYLRQGITWIPEYTFRIVDDEHGELTLRGTVVNEAEDLIHCDVHFVVGVPHFIHDNLLAPIAVGQVIRTIGASVAPIQTRSQIASDAFLFSNAIRADQVGPGVVEQPAGGENRDIRAVLGNLPSLEGPASADYTVYTKKDLTLRQGEKAIVTLFVKKISYSHIYRWNPPAQIAHYLVLHNDTDTAWTTGPCLAIDGERPLSEDLIKYTPKQGHCEIPVTTAVNVACNRSESEADRKLKAHSPAPNFFLDLVTLRGELKVRSFEKTAVTVAIETPVPGKPTVASDDGDLSVDTSKLQLLERSGAIRWQTRLDSGASKTLTYQYERYVPSK